MMDTTQSKTTNSGAANTSLAEGAPESCCGGPEPSGTSACCALDAEVKSTGGTGCGCGGSPIQVAGQSNSSHQDAFALGLTPHVDDDNPLWADLDESGRVRRLGGNGGAHVTAGLYWLPARPVAEPSADFGRLRDYLKWLVDAGAPVYGVVLPLVFDIDRAHDVKAAESAGLGRRPEAMSR